MARNPNKTRCQVPGCRNWAMRGHTHCRSHRDAELGPRGGGAPTGNLNALKTGQYAHPFEPASLRHLAQQLASDPQRLPAYLERAIASIHARTGNPVQALIAIQVALAQLLPLVAQDLFLAGLQDLLRRLPPQRRIGVQAILYKHALPLSPQKRLRLLRATAARFEGHLLAHDRFLPTIGQPQGPRSSSPALQPVTPQSPHPQRT